MLRTFAYGPPNHTSFIEQLAEYFAKRYPVIRKSIFWVFLKSNFEWTLYIRLKDIKGTQAVPGGVGNHFQLSVCTYSLSDHLLITSGLVSKKTLIDFELFDHTRQFPWVKVEVQKVINFYSLKSDTADRYKNVVFQYAIMDFLKMFYSFH